MFCGRSAGCPRNNVAIAAILLAAGESRRMGCPKALLDWDGRPLLAYQLAELDGSRVDRVVIVLGHRARDVLPLCRGLQAPKEAQREGPSHCVGALAWAGRVGMGGPQARRSTRLTM